MAHGKARVAKKSTKLNAKGKRWLKGQSSSSNPTANKYREAAKKGYFVSSAENKSSLTTDALLKHNAQLQNEDELCFHSQALSISDDLESAEVKTFATNYTTCTNPSFESFFKNWKPHLASHKDGLAILAAVTDVIKQNNGKGTATEYFAALLTTLGVLDNTELLSAGVVILSMVIKKVPSSVLKVKFSESTKLFQDLIEFNIDGQNPHLLRSLIGCLSIVLRNQEASVWKHSSTVQTYLKVLSLSVHPKPRVRKAAQHAVCSILKGTCFMVINHPAASHTAKFCVYQLNLAGSVASSTVLHIFSLLKSVLALFSTEYIKSTCEAVFRCRMSANNALVTTCSFDVLYGLFVSRPTKENLPSELNAQIINALYDYQPSIKDSKQLVSWITALKEAHLNLLSLNGRLCLEHMVRCFSTITRLWASPKSEIRTTVTTTLKALLRSFESSILSEIENIFLLNHEDMSIVIKKLFESVESCLGYQFHEVWPNVFQVISVFFEVFAKMGQAFMGNCLKSLAELRNSVNFSYLSELDNVIGQAIKSFGPKMVLNHIPLNLEQDRPNLNQSWLILVLRDNIQETELSFFKEFFLPLIEKFNQKVLYYHSNDNNALKMTYQLLIVQLWSLLPGFCNLPTDLIKSFKLIAKDLGRVLSGGYADYKLHILTALRLLIIKNLNNDQNKAEMSNFAKNYMPILFNLYTQSPTSEDKAHEGFRMAVFDTIKVYLDITDGERCKMFFQDAIKFLNTNEDFFKKNAILDIMRVLLSHLKKEFVEILYNICVPLLKSENRTTQKKAYRIIEEICIGKSDPLVEFVKLNLGTLKNILANSLSITSPSAKAPRLRCLNYIVLQLHEDEKEFLLSIIPEVISCAKENARKVRLAANNIIINIGKKFIQFGGKNEQVIIEDYIGILLAGLVGSTHLICSTVATIALILQYFREKISKNVLDTVLNSLIILGRLKTRTVISEVLDFIKVIISSFNDIVVASIITKIFDILKYLTKDYQLHFRMKIRRILQRLVRKLGFEMVRELTPESYQKLLTYIHKQEVRDKKVKAESGLSEEGNEEKSGLQYKSQSIEELLQDSDSEEEDEQSSVSKTIKKQSTLSWIHEEAETEIVDLLDPKTSKNILATNPGKNHKVSSQSKDIKYAADGRMIIFDDEEDTASSNALDFIDDHKVNKRKRDKNYHDGSESLEDNAASSKVGHGPNMETAAMKKQRFSGGEEYKAKKAGGDMKRKGKPDPYAYFPLEIQSLNKRKRAKMSGKFKTVVRSARKGAQLGTQKRSRNKKTKL